MNRFDAFERMNSFRYFADQAKFFRRCQDRLRQLAAIRMALKCMGAW